MKYLALLLILVSSLQISAQNAPNVPNRGFENWEDEFIFELPDYWATSNEREGRDNVFKTTDARTGDFGLRIENKVDSTFGYFMMGHVGENGPDGGFPYTSDFDSVTGWYKCDMMQGDSALVITMKFGPNDTTIVMSHITGTANTWTRFSFPVPTHAQTHVFFGVVGTDPFKDGNYFPDSWIIIDDVAFTKASGMTPDTLQNNSFERWDSIVATEPIGWNSVNFMSVTRGDTLSVQQTSDAHNGDYAVKVVAVDLENISKVGWLYNGDPPGPGGFKGGFAYDAIPQSFSGYYKYEPVGTDTAMIAILGSHYDATEDTTTDLFFAHTPLFATNTYSHFNIPIDYDTTGPKLNQLNIVAVSSYNMFDNPEQVQSGTALFLDDLWIESQCAFADTTELFANTDTTINYNRTETPTFSLDTNYASYLWSNGDTSHTITVNSNPMTVSVTVIDSNGCIFQDELIIHLNLLVNIDEVDPVIKVYPNPMSKHLTIETQTDYTLSIYSLHGQLLKHQQVQKGKTQIDVSALNSGHYVLLLTNDKGEYKRLLIFKE